MRILHLQVRSGLCNRLRALLSAVSAAEATGRALRVTWTPSPQCGARLDDLWSHPFRETNRLERRRWRVSDINDSRYLPDLTGEEPARIVHVRSGKVLMEGTPATRGWPGNLQQMQPLPELQERLDRVDELLGDAPRVGIQLRTHPSAHHETLAASPVSWYVEQLRPIVERVPGVRIFGSFDTPESESEMRSVFGDALITTPDKGAFNSVRGVQDAVCDLYLLSRCDVIFGAHLSSIGSTAGYLQARTAYASARLQAGLTWEQVLLS
jgi:hypothetical protein